MNVNVLLTAFEPPLREQILREMCRSSDFTNILGYSATKDDAARKISLNERLCEQIELTLIYEPF